GYDGRDTSRAPPATPTARSISSTDEWLTKTRVTSRQNGQTRTVFQRRLRRGAGRGVAVAMKINHEETKSTKKGRKKTSCSSFLRGLFFKGDYANTLARLAVRVSHADA